MGRLSKERLRGESVLIFGWVPDLGPGHGGKPVSAPTSTLRSRNYGCHQAVRSAAIPQPSKIATVQHAQCRVISGCWWMACGAPTQHSSSKVHGSDRWVSTEQNHGVFTVYLVGVTAQLLPLGKRVISWCRPATSGACHAPHYLAQSVPV
jgi:hypothetical protein